MRYVLEHLGVAVFAIAGALAAKNKRVDLFGVLVLALVTAMGGGTLRDLILRIPPFWTVDESFVFGATTAALATSSVAPLRGSRSMGGFSQAAALSRRNKLIFAPASE
jgi:uncharacterized membrane protein YeiH